MKGTKSRVFVNIKHALTLVHQNNSIMDAQGHLDRRISQNSEKNRSNR